jgi:L-lactate dehydrogenase
MAPVIAIVGAGEVGGAAARALAVRGRVPAIRLIDEHLTVAAGKALDLRQAMPISPSDVRIEGQTDIAACSGASAIVLADSAASGEWSGEAALALLRRLSRLGVLEHAVLICAGATHVPVMQRAFDDLRLSRARTLGSAPQAFASLVRALVAVEAHASPAQISLTALGLPPQRSVIVWSEASIAGHAVTSILAPPQIHSIERRAAGLWPPGPSTLGSSAALFAESIVTGSRRLVSAHVSLDRDNGTTAPVCAWSVVIGPDGLERVITPALTGRERTLLDGVLDS